MNIGLYASVSGLLAAQRAVDVASHNIANAESEGFSRQRTATSTSVPLGVAAVGNLGTGIKLDGVMRVRDELLDRQLRQEAATLGEMETRAASLGQIEELLGEPGEGSLSSRFAVYYESWNKVSTNPENTGFRLALREAAVNLAQTFNRLSRDIETYRSELDARANEMVADINTKTEQIGELNRQIIATLVQGQNPNDLQDQRDLIIEQLSRMIKVQVVPVASSGAVNLYVGGQPIVADRNSYPLSPTLVESTTDIARITFENNGEKADIQGGALKALLDLRNVTLSGQAPTAAGQAKGLLRELDELADTLLRDTNTLHESGFGLDGSSGTPFFVRVSAFESFPGESAASNITLNPALLDSFDQIAGEFRYGYLSIATASQEPSAPSSGQSDNEQARLIAGRRFAKVLGAPIANKTFEEHWQAAVLSVSFSTQSATRAAKTQETLLAAVKERRDMVSSVSTDEEMANVIRYQKAYAASARMISTIDEMLDILLSIKR